MSLSFTADENVNKRLVQLLRDEGYSVVHVAEVCAGAPDDEVLHRTNEQDSIFLTTDKHFGELIFRQRKVAGGCFFSGSMHYIQLQELDVCLNYQQHLRSKYK